jgi:L-threonylcarbamoyladenylate synthase
MTATGQLTIDRAVHCLRDGEVIAYPTEAVYGLGCDPKNESAVRKVLALKDRPASAGLILIGEDISHFDAYVGPIDPVQRERALSSWPGPVTWLFPRAKTVPDWLAGDHDTIAVRLTAHPVCRALCAAFEGAIVSTSANPRGAEPARSARSVIHYFGDGIAGVVAGDLGGQKAPSEIRDLASGQVIREA